MRPNVLVSSAGRRVQLVRCFQRALERLNVAGRVIVADMNPDWAAAARVADAAYAAPPTTDRDFAPFLDDLVRREDIGLIVPTLDTELIPLAGRRHALAAGGCSIAISDLSLIEICRDKRNTAQWFSEHGFEIPRMFPREELRFPCFAKPYDGSLSRGTQAILSERMLSPALLDDDTLIFMEYFSPEEFDEFTVDLYYDHDGDLKCLVPRKRIEVRGGEISKGVALKGRTYAYLHDRLEAVEGARGCLTLQLFVSRDEDRWVASELNARFGGGYPLSYHAGADYPEWLIREYLRRERLPFYDQWEEGTAMVRYDTEIVFPLGSR